MDDFDAAILLILLCNAGALAVILRGVIVLWI